MNILVIEDEPKTMAYLSKGLAEKGYRVNSAINGEEGFHMAQEGACDLLVLDVMLPGKDGWSILEDLRRSGRHFPILLLTARDSVEDRVRGLESGADDYLVKPFAFAELLARVQTLLRRGQARPSEIAPDRRPGESTPSTTRPSGPAGGLTSPPRNFPSSIFLPPAPARFCPGPASLNRCGT